MRSFGNIRQNSPYAIFAFLATAILATGYFDVSSSTRTARQLFESKVTRDKWNHSIREALSKILGKAADERFHINSFPTQDGVNIYVVDCNATTTNGLRHNLDSFRNNCAFVGENIIVCDLGFLDSFLIRRGHTVSAEGQALNEFLDGDHLASDSQTTFLAWVLGHELGHLLLHHKPAHFQENAFEAQHPRNFSHEQELAADKFVAKMIGTNKDATIALIQCLNWLLTCEIARRNGPATQYGVGIIYDTGKHITRHDTTTHPDFIYRGISLLKELGSVSQQPGVIALANSIEGQLGI